VFSERVRPVVREIPDVDHAGARSSPGALRRPNETKDGANP
jgi:hypothetical protein